MGKTDYQKYKFLVYTQQQIRLAGHMRYTQETATSECCVNCIGDIRRRNFQS